MYVVSVYVSKETNAKFSQILDKFSPNQGPKAQVRASGARQRI